MPERHGIFTVPAGRLVLLIDDDDTFVASSDTRLRKKFDELAPARRDLQILTADTTQRFDAIVAILREDDRLKDLIYAFVDLNLPETRSAAARPENGMRVVAQLRNLIVPTVVFSDMSPEKLKRIFDDNPPRFITKEEWNTDARLRPLCLEVLSRLDERPAGTAQDCEVLCSPVAERQRTRRLPFAFGSPAMRSLRNRIPKVAAEAAAVLAVGDPGVEFEQLAWLLYKEITKAGGCSYHYHSFNASTGGPPTPLLQNINGGDERSCHFLFVRNLHALDAAELERFCDELAQSASIRVAGNRAFLTVHRDRVYGAHKQAGIDHLLDLFCLAGFEDFVLLDVPALARSRPDDVKAYAKHFLDEWRADAKRPVLTFDEPALDLISKLEYERHFKDLAIFLDRLFHDQEGGVINSAAVRRMRPEQLVVDTAADSIIKLILQTGPDEPSVDGSWSSGPLFDRCNHLAVEYKGNEGDADLSAFIRDLEQIVSALEQAKRLDTDAKGASKALLQAGANLWPWSRYPICPRLMAQLERHRLTVGVVQPRS